MLTRNLILCALHSVMVPLAAHSAPIATVDQEQIGLDFNANIGVFAPIGQSFTPTLSGLDAVELMMIDSEGPPGNVFVRIRTDTINGSIIGTSFTNSLPDGSAGILHFDFASTVALTPGNVYVIEAVLESGSSNVHWIGSDSNPYSGGTAFLAGGVWADDDMWFREGLHTAVPEPSTFALCVLGALSLAIWHGRRCRGAIL